MPRKKPEPQPFWRAKSFVEMTAEEWESLCDRCGRCCLIKLEYEDTGEVVYTDVACALLDLGTCRCTDYDNRHARVSDCLRLSPENIGDVGWLPPTCAYRLVAQARDLYWWHPLISGTYETVVQAGVSVKSRVVSERDIGADEVETRAAAWPQKNPGAMPGKP